MSAPTPTYTTLTERPFSTHYVWAEAIINHDVEKVWEYALDLPRWMGANHEWEPISGASGKAGMLWRLWPYRHYVGDDCPPPHYHFVGIAKVIRHKLIAIEVWMEKGGSYGDKFASPSFRGLDSLLLTDLGGATNVRGLFIATSDPEPDQLIDISEDEELEPNVMIHLENLQRVIDGEPLDPPATRTFREADSS